MQTFSPSLHRSFGFAACPLLAGTMAAACSDDGNLLGTENGGKGGGGQPMAGSSSGGSSGLAGTGANGGKGGEGGSAPGGSAGNAASGNANGGASSGGAGGEPACEQGLCIRANVCLDRCGGSQVYTGCCACPANTVEELTCTGSGGNGGGGGSGADCAGETCAANETCVGYRVVGGAVFPPDQNNECPAGRHLEANTCQYDFSYTCATLTNCNAPSATCRCAPGTDCANTTQCRLPPTSAWLDPDAQLVCELLAP